MQTVLAHGVDPAAPGTLTFSADSELQEVTDVRQRAQLILLHQRALPQIEAVHSALSRLTHPKLLAQDAKLLQVWRCMEGSLSFQSYPLIFFV